MHASVTDSGAGPVGDVTAYVDTSTAGAHTVSLRGFDRAGRTAAVTCGYRVVYDFSGFSAPLSPTSVNVARAGQAIPLKWRATAAAGSPVTTLTTVRVTVAGHSCDLGATEDLIEESTAGASGLRHLGDGYYQFNWATPRDYAGSCKTLRLDQGDGARQTAEFRFR